jgi:hypothetical protein
MQIQFSSSPSNSCSIDPLEISWVEVFKYTTTSALALGIWGAFYYYEICDSEQRFTNSCGSPKTSLTINLGVPLIALGAAIKAHQAFKTLWH